MTNLIGIAGRAMSGKDTAAKIILGLTREKLMFSNLGWSSWEIKKYSRKLKQIASLLTGIPEDKFEDQAFKRTHLGPEWAHDDKDGIKYMTVRYFLQILGTEAVRDTIHPQTWINALFADWKKNSKWIITDCRFKNEFDAIKHRGGKVIFLNRGSEDADPHSSETEMMFFKHECDIIIDNTGTVDELESMIEFFLRKEEIIK